MAELPITRGVFLCENVIVEEHTRRVSLINCFTELVVDSFPSPPQQFYVYAVFTNGNGAVPLRFVISDSDEEVLVEQVGHSEFPDPLHELRTLIGVRDLVFDTAGVYDVVFESNGIDLGRARLELVSSEGKL